MEKGKLVIFTAPSGAGKTTIVKHLLSRLDNFAFSVSATSRPKRDYEVEGQHYYFLSPTEFRRRIENDEFMEWQEVYDGQYYGTLKSEIEKLWDAGKHIIFDIDVKGAYNLKQNYTGHALAIFVKPPSTEILYERLRKRGTETPESFRKRVKRATLELSYEDKFDYVLLNDDLQQAVNEAEQVVLDYLNR